MIKILYIIFLSLIVANCSFKNVVKHHGVPFLEKKQTTLVVNKSNKNDITKILGYPSTTSKFDNYVWIYIERKETQSELIRLGKMKISKNDILVLEIDKYGILKNKKFYKKNEMKNINIDDEITDVTLDKKSFIYDFMSSLRQKINDPLNKRVNKRK